MNVAKYTLAKQEGACMKGLRSTIGIYSFHVFKLWPFLNAPIRPGIRELKNHDDDFVDDDRK